MLCVLLLKYLLGVVFGVHLVDDADEDAVLVEDEGFAESTERHLAVEILFSPCAKSLEHLGGWITQEREGQVVFGFELDVRGSRILAHTEDLVAVRGRHGSCRGGYMLRLYNPESSP